MGEHTWTIGDNEETLILTHLSRRNRERDVISEARAIFPNTFVARDFDRYSVVKNKPVTRLEPTG